MRSAVALDDRDRLGEVIGVGAADAEQVDLLLGQAPDPQRHLAVDMPTWIGASGRGDHVDHRADRGRHPGRVDHDRRPRRAGPVARGGHHLVSGLSTAASVRRARRRAASRGSCGSIISTSAAGSAATSDTHWPIGPAPSTTTRSPPSIRRAADGPDGDRHRLGHRRDAGVGGLDREHLLLAGDQLLLQATVDVDPDQLEVVAGVRPPDRARVALPARAQGPQRDPLADLELGAAVTSERGDRGRRPRGPARAGTANPRRRPTARR